VAWNDVRDAADLGCGSGRTAAWLRDKGVEAIDGVDLTPEMLAQAESRGCHRHLHVADVPGTGLADAEYDLVACSLHPLGEHVAAARRRVHTDRTGRSGRR
jgi:predicted TPR repeat methyltransferase